MTTPKTGPRDRWLQLAYVALCAAQQGIECTDEALMAALFTGMPSVNLDDVTAAAIAQAIERVGSIQEAAALLDRSRSFLYDSLKRRQREWATADWVGYGREVRRRRLLAGWSVSQMSRIINLSPHTLRRVEAGRGPLRPSDLTLAKLATALGMPLPPPSEPPVRQKAPSK